MGCSITLTCFVNDTQLPAAKQTSLVFTPLLIHPMCFFSLYCVLFSKRLHISVWNVVVFVREMHVSEWLRLTNVTYANAVENKLDYLKVCVPDDLWITHEILIMLNIKWIMPFHICWLLNLFAVKKKERKKERNHKALSCAPLLEYFIVIVICITVFLFTFVHFIRWVGGVFTKMGGVGGNVSFTVMGKGLAI